MWSYWEKLCLYLVNDEFDADMRPLVKGVWINHRFDYDVYKVSLWTSNFEENLDKQHRIGRKMKEILHLDCMGALVFETNETAIEKNEKQKIFKLKRYCKKSYQKIKRLKNRLNLTMRL